MVDDKLKSEDQKRSDGLTDLIRGAISTGVKSVFMTEEGLRNMVSDFVPKEISAYIRSQLDGVKKDVYSSLVSEFSNYLDKFDIGEEVRKVLTGMTVNIDVKLSFEEKKPGARRKK